MSNLFSASYSVIRSERIRINGPSERSRCRSAVTAAFFGNRYLCTPVQSEQSGHLDDYILCTPALACTFENRTDFAEFSQVGPLAMENGYFGAEHTWVRVVGWGRVRRVSPPLDFMAVTDRRRTGPFNHTRRSSEPVCPDRDGSGGARARSAGLHQGHRFDADRKATAVLALTLQP